MTSENEFNRLTERVKDSTLEALKRHSEFGEPIVYREGSKLVYEYLNGEKEFKEAPVDYKEIREKVLS